MHGNPLGHILFESSPQRLHRLPHVPSSVQHQKCLRSLPIFGGKGGRGRFSEPPVGTQSAQRVLDPRQGRLNCAVRDGEHDNGRDDPLRAKVFQFLRNNSRVGACGKVRGLFVRGHLADPAEIRAANSCQGRPNQYQNRRNQEPDPSGARPTARFGTCRLHFVVHGASRSSNASPSK